VALVVCVSLQHLILRDQTLGAFGQKYFMPKFYRGLYFSTFDEVGVRLKDGSGISLILTMIIPTYMWLALITPN
jgi:hypothetical protein